MCIAPSIPPPPKERRAPRAPTAQGITSDRARSMMGSAATILTSPLGIVAPPMTTKTFLGQ
jgi:hypothetical protein